MNDAIRLLFQTLYGEEQSGLFRSRLDLANALLNEEGSKYYLNSDEKMDSTRYAKDLNKLQSYISQVLSGTGTRRITPEFKESLQIILLKKLENVSGVSPQNIFENIINSLEENNIKTASVSADRVNKNILLDEFIDDLIKAKYAAIFTSRPLELEANPNEDILKIRQVTVNGICNYFSNNFENAQKFRYNFPNNHLGILFWRRISNLLIKRIGIDSIETEKLDLFVKKILQENPDWQVHFNDRLNANKTVLKRAETKEEKLRQNVYHFLAYVNDKACFQVFESNEPVFVIPHIVLNPNESHNIKGYIYLDQLSDSVKLYKYTGPDLTVWKDKVWDKIKANKNTKQISFIESIEDNVVLNFH